MGKLEDDLYFSSGEAQWALCFIKKGSTGESKPWSLFPTGKCARERGHPGQCGRRAGLGRVPSKGCWCPVSICPSHPLGVPFPKNFQQVCTKILTRLFRVFVHVYIHHFDSILSMGAEAHVNTCYKHFYYFIREFSLVDQRELEPLVRPSPHCPPLPGLASVSFQIQSLPALRKSNTQVDISGDCNSFNSGFCTLIANSFKYQFTDTGLPPGVGGW